MGPYQHEDPCSGSCVDRPSLHPHGSPGRRQGTHPDLRIRKPSSQKSLSRLTGHGIPAQVWRCFRDKQSFCSSYRKDSLDTYLKLQDVPVWLFQLTPSWGFSPVSIPGAPSPSTCRQETEEQHRSGRPEAIGPRPRAVSTRGSPPLCPQEPSGARAAALAFGRLPWSRSGCLTRGSGAGFGLSVCFCWQLSHQWGGLRGQRASHLGWVLTGDAHRDRLRRRYRAFSDVEDVGSRGES